MIVQNMWLQYMYGKFVTFTSDSNSSVLNKTQQDATMYQNFIISYFK
jgi:hypothetical protein